MPEILATVGSAGVSTGCGCTVSVKMDVPEFPASSDAVHAIMLVPIGKFVGRYVDVIEVTVLNGSDWLPAVQVGPELTPILSTADTSKPKPTPVEFVAIFVWDPTSPSKDVIVIAGAVLSIMVCVIPTVKDILPEFPAASDAVHVTVVVPIPNIEPDGLSHVGPDVTATLSVADGRE